MIIINYTLSKNHHLQIINFLCQVSKGFSRFKIGREGIYPASSVAPLTIYRTYTLTTSPTPQKFRAENYHHPCLQI